MTARCSVCPMYSHTIWVPSGKDVHYSAPNLLETKIGPGPATLDICMTGPEKNYRIFNRLIILLQRSDASHTFCCILKQKRKSNSWQIRDDTKFTLQIMVTGCYLHTGLITKPLSRRKWWTLVGCSFHSVDLSDTVHVGQSHPQRTRGRLYELYSLSLGMCQVVDRLFKSTAFPSFKISPPQTHRLSKTC